MNSTENTKDLVGERHKQIGSWLAAIFALLGFALLLFWFYNIFYIQQGKLGFSDKLLLPVTILILAAGVAGYLFIRRGRLVVGLWVVFGAVLFPPVAATLVIKNVVLVTVSYLIIFASIFIIWVLPRSSRRLAAIATVAAGLVIAGIEIWQPAFRVGSTSLSAAGPFIIAAVGLTLFALFIRQAYQRNLRVKIVASFTVTTVIAVAIVGADLYFTQRNQIREDLRQRLLNMVSIAALQQDGDAFLTISSASDAEFERVRAQNLAIRYSSPDIMYVYTMRYDDQGLYFVVDAGEPGEENIAPFRKRYEEPSPTLLANYRTITKPIVDDDVYTDEYGSFLSAYSPIWTDDGKLAGILAIDIAADKVLALERAVLYQILRSILITLLIVTLIGLYLGNLFVGPIVKLSAVAKEVAEGDLSARAKIVTQDEVGELAQNFNIMTTQLQETLQGLEQRVAERTQSLALAADVGRSVSQVRALDVMLKDAAEIIRSRFDLYYTQVYLTNPAMAELVLNAGTGKVGAELLGRRHRLPLDTGSINGRAAVEKRSVVISDTISSTTFRPNPLLPETRSEMAVPLMVGENVVGVLDLQSQIAGALSEDLLPAFEALAGQLAIAIQNASLLAEAEQARAEVENQARRLVRGSWSDYLDAVHKPEQTGFVFEQNQVKPLDAAGESNVRNAVNVPIAITGESIGSIVVDLEVEKQTSRNLELVNTIAHQVAQQVENLRLLESAERYRFEAEQAMQRVTREGWKTYMESTTGRLGYMFDRKEVVPVEADHRNGADAVTLPIKVRDEEVGKFALMEVDRNDGQSLELANAVAERLSAHIESLRQFDQTQSALAQSEKLFEASRVLTQAKDLQELLQVVAGSLNIPEINRATLGIFHYGKENELENMTVTANWWNGTGNKPTEIGRVYPVNVFRTFSLFSSPTPLFTNDAFNDPRVDATTLELAKRQNLRAVAVLPLYQGSLQVGVLMLEAEQPHNFTQDEMRLFSALAPQIATVMENRRQYEQAQKQAERESTLNVISQKIQSATTVEAVLQIAARELGHALGAPLTIAQLGIKDK